MTRTRDRKWLSFQGLAGGLAVFAAEAMIVVGLAVVAWIISVVLLAIL